jgi:3-hydroxyacyl-CoA dehydrogenase
VHLRPAVEVVSGPRSEGGAVAAASEHAARIGKQTIPCRDGPGFIVNRMLSPYLNQALWLLCRGASEWQIEHAARAYGMPLSPLELIDWIGTATMYHAGKAFWSAFPKRLEPSPVIPALLKRRRFGRAFGAGLYDYDRGVRSSELAVETCEILHRYRRDPRTFSDGDVLELLTIPMWIEATKLLDEGVADSIATVDLAMAGGLGYNSDVTWSGFFAQLGRSRIADSIERHREQWNSMRI